MRQPATSYPTVKLALKPAPMLTVALISMLGKGAPSGLTASRSTATPTPTATPDLGDTLDDLVNGGSMGHGLLIGLIGLLGLSRRRRK